MVKVQETYAIQNSSDVGQVFTWRFPCTGKPDSLKLVKFVIDFGVFNENLIIFFVKFVMPQLYGIELLIIIEIIAFCYSFFVIGVFRFEAGFALLIKEMAAFR